MRVNPETGKFRAHIVSDFLCCSDYRTLSIALALQKWSPPLCFEDFHYSCVHLEQFSFKCVNIRFHGVDLYC